MNSLRYSFRWQHKKLPIKEYHTIMGIHSKSEKNVKKQGGLIYVSKENY